jgi:hypothetical protein
MVQILVPGSWFGSGGLRGADDRQVHYRISLQD